MMTTQEITDSLLRLYRANYWYGWAFAEGRENYAMADLAIDAIDQEVAKLSEVIPPDPLPNLEAEVK